VTTTVQVARSTTRLLNEIAGVAEFPSSASAGHSLSAAMFRLSVSFLLLPAPTAAGPPAAAEARSSSAARAPLGPASCPTRGYGRGLRCAPLAGRGRSPA